MITITDKEFEQLTAYIKQKYGIKLGREKRALLLGRLQNTLHKQNFNDFSSYYKYLLADKTGAADVALVNVITTNHTFFMREANHFHYFRDKVLPWLEQSVRDKDLRIWCAGCSTGEEPYTLAMIIDDYFGMNKPQWDAKLLATDISKRALEVAEKGIYSQESLLPISESWRNKYFNIIDGQSSAVSAKIKNEVIFRQFNLISECFHFKKKFQAIFCRNVMIYFDAETRNALVNRFYDFTEEGGFLFIGHSESLDREQTKYKYVMPAVYRKERR